MKRTLFSAAAALAGVVYADRNSFDCLMRNLAVEFAASANPHLSTAQLQGIADAIVGAPETAPGCNVTVPAGLASERQRPRFRAVPLPTAGQTFYVDYNGGSDSNSGTIGAPFKTVARGVAATRAAGGGGNIVLRNGTHFLSDVITLDGGDSGLSLSAYPGEAPWLSRGIPLTGITWNPVNSSSAGGWQVFQNQNAVYGGTNNYPFAVNSTQPSWQACQAQCQANMTAGGPCTIWTWHDANATGYELQCWFRLDNVWSPTAQADHVSGFYAPPPNIWSADLSAYRGQITQIVGLRNPDGSRMIRARYPNANPEYGFGSNLNADSWTAPEATQPIQPAIHYEPDTPFRNSSYSFQRFNDGIGGICGVPGFGFEPPVGYWCSNTTEGGGAFTWRTPYGMTASNGTLPHQPYANISGAVIQAWHPARWASRMYLMAEGGYSFDAGSGKGNFSFAAGGYQDARGSDNAGNFYIENVMEELDAPGEWYFNTSTFMLYAWYNATAGVAPPSDGSIVAINDGDVGLINVSATQAAPLTGLTLQSVGFRDTANVFFAPHTIPSGGDWATARLAAVQLEGTEGAIVDSCVFERLDGTALLLSGYNRNAQVSRNEFVWIGDSAIISWGRTTGDPTGVDGPDGTDGNQPRYNLIAYNYAHEIGLWEKQSSLYMQARTSDSLLVGNVGFNGPRAGVNFNDGFGGNSTLDSNLIFNMCRESGDHGPFNSWDRQVFETYKGGIYQDYNVLTRNFLLSNYESQEGIDNDDGSAYYHSHHNFLVYSGNGMKSDFGGHDNIHESNVYAYIGRGFSICNQLQGHGDSFYSNHVVQTGDGDYGSGQACTDGPNNGITNVYNNTVYTPTGAVTECGMTLAQWQAKGGDPGTTANVTPDDATLIALARNVLGM